MSTGHGNTLPDLNITVQSTDFGMNNEPIDVGCVESAPQFDPISIENKKTQSFDQRKQPKVGEVSMEPLVKRERHKKYEAIKEMLTGVPTAIETYGAGSFTPLVVTVPPGEDILNKICVLGERNHQSLCIFSANGIVSEAVMCPSFTTEYTEFVKYKGCYEITSLSGSFIYHKECSLRKLSTINLLLASPNQSVFGGPILSGTPLIAASPIQLVLGAYNQDLEENEHGKQGTSSTSFMT